MADKKLTGLTDLAAQPENGDFVHVVDVSDTSQDAAGSSKKVQYLNLKNVIQEVRVRLTAGVEGTATMVIGATPPQISDGTLGMSAVITPTSATSILVIKCDGFLASSATSDYVTVAMFRDTTANAIAARPVYGVAEWFEAFALSDFVVAGSVAATTFSVRFGRTTAGTVSLGRRTSEETFGSINKGSLIITEYAA